METRHQNWQKAFDINTLSDLEPSECLQTLAEANIIGMISDQKAEELLQKYYHNDLENRLYQNDLVILRIKRLLSIDSFTMSKEFLFAIHKYLFKDIYNHAGQMRTVELVKKEFCLKGGTVLYAPWRNINDYLSYDFDLIKEKDLSTMSTDKLIITLGNFISSIWQAHPFREGNTRCVCVFLEKYLKYLGFVPDNNLFKENSVYFRNALVRSNQCNYNNIKPDFSYLYTFLRKMLVDSSITLDPMDTIIAPELKLQ